MNMNPHQTICKPEHQQDGAAKATKFWLLVILLALNNSSFFEVLVSIWRKKIYKSFCKDYFGDSLSPPRPYIH